MGLLFQDEILVVLDQDPGGWWTAADLTGDRVGKIPKNYVEICDYEEPKAAEDQTVGACEFVWVEN